MVLWVYRVLFVPVLVALAPFQWWHMRRRGGYREAFGERFGGGAVLPAKVGGRPRVWLQAVSVGEMLAVGPILDALIESGAEVVVTTTTSTGYRLARERYAGKVLAIGYFPLDWLPFTRRAWRRIDADVAILTEGERWPEFIAEAARRGVPLVAMNARLSDRSFQRMRRMGPWLAPLWRGITHLLPATEADALRFRELGFAPRAMVVTGNIKLDVAVNEIGPEARSQWRAELGLGTTDSIVLGASTWPGEERAMVAAWQGARAAGHGGRLLLVPRHAERRREIEAELETLGVRYHFRSRGMASDQNIEVAVADTTGELAQLTRLGDVVFVGKSLPPHHAGQTPVEAAALGRPLLFGPAMSNFRVIARELVEAGAAQRVQSAEHLAEWVTRLLSNETERIAMSAAGRSWHQRNRGAVERTMTVLRALLATAAN